MSSIIKRFPNAFSLLSGIGIRVSGRLRAAEMQMCTIQREYDAIVISALRNKLGRKIAYINTGIMRGEKKK